MQSGIYRISNVVNGKAYVGSAKNFRTRWNAHRCLLRQGKHHCAHLQAAWNREGANAFAFEVIEQCGMDALIEREQFWIDSLNTFNRAYGYNARPIASNQTGLKHTADTIKRISRAKQGSIPWNKGKPMSEESKEKLRVAKLGRKHSDETKRLMSDRRKGRRHSEETRNLMSEIAKAKGRRVSAIGLANSVATRRAKAKEIQNGIT